MSKGPASTDLPALRWALRRWFARHARSFPWRQTDDPYAIWVSETMLQQTQTATVVPYYERFMRRFPTVQALAAAPLDDVLKHWEGLGYYRRARNLHEAARQVVARHGGELPADEASLLALPGVGRYTAGAIRSLAFGQPAPVLDGNVRRLISRLDDLSANIDEAATERLLWQRAAELVDPQAPGEMNEAMIELGATVCLPRQPRCALCPLQDFCRAYAAGTQYERPVRSPRRRTPHYDVVAGIVWHASRPRTVLIAQRPLDGMLGGLWEFPGGKVQDGETQPQALQRELQEELGIEVAVGAHALSLDHAYTHFRITLHAWHARHVGGAPRPLQVADWRWATLDELDAFAFPRTDQQISAALQSDASFRR